MTPCEAMIRDAVAARRMRSTVPDLTENGLGSPEFDNTDTTDSTPHAAVAAAVW